MISSYYSKDWDDVVIPISEKDHWICAVIVVHFNCICIFDSFRISRNKIRTAAFRQLLKICTIFCHTNEKDFNQNQWKLIQPVNLPNQNDTFNCGIFAFLNAKFMLDTYTNSNEEDKVVVSYEDIDKVRDWLLCKIPATSKYKTPHIKQIKPEDLSTVEKVLEKEVMGWKCFQLIFFVKFYIL